MSGEGSFSQVRHQSEGCSGSRRQDQKDEVLLGRFVRWRRWGIEWEADVKHRKLLLERFGLVGNAKALSVNGDWGDWVARIKTLMYSPMRPKSSVQQS